MNRLFYLLLFSAVFFYHARAQVLKIETLSTGLVFPVGIQNTGVPNDNRLFILEKRGRIKIVDRLTGVVNPVPFLDIYSRVYPVASQGDERGLLGLAFHPDYANNGFFYIHYVATNGKTIVARYKVSPFADTALKYSEQIIFNLYDPYANHNGGNLMFGPEDGYLYISLGDGGSSGDPGNRAQNKDSLLGKILRVDINNPAPPYYFSVAGNPFYGATPGRDEIFHWGLRNPWRCSFDRVNHDMWIGDVGQNLYEEIDFARKCDMVGHNYGWRCYEGNNTYNIAGCLTATAYVAPVFAYSQTFGCSVSGGYVYRGGEEGALFGKYLFADYCSGRVWASVPNGTGGFNTGLLTQSTPTITNNLCSFGEDIYGELYVAGIASGRIYRVRDTACAPTAYINAPDTLFICAGSQPTFNAIYGTGLSYTWAVTGGSWAIATGQGSNVITTTPDLNAIANVVVSVSNGTCTAISNTVVVVPRATIGGLDPAYCIFSPSIVLTGSPPGGTFSGPGINGNVFSPSTAGAGTHFIFYTVTDTASSCYFEASGCILNGSKSVAVNVCDGLEENDGFYDLKIYPNPLKSEFFISITCLAADQINLTITDALGRVVLSQAVETVGGQQELKIQIPDVSQGAYFLTLKTKHGSMVEKIFVLK